MSEQLQLRPFLEARIARRTRGKMYEVTGRVGDREAEPATMNAGQLAEMTVVGDSAPVLTISDWEIAPVDSAVTTTGQWRAPVSGLYEITAGQPPRLIDRTDG